MEFRIHRVRNLKRKIRYTVAEVTEIFIFNNIQKSYLTAYSM